MHRFDADPGATVDPALFPIENPNPVFRIAAGGLIVFANRASDDLLAVWGTRVGEPLPAEWQQHFASALSVGTRTRRLVPCGDRVYDLDFVPIPARNYVNVYGRDVTEQEAVRRERETLLAELQHERDQAEERAAELAALLALLPSGVAISYDPECRDIRVNPALARMLDTSLLTNVSLSVDEREREASYRVFDRAGRELAPNELPMQAAAARGAAIRDEVIDILRGDGVRLTLLSYAVPLMDGLGQPRGAVGAYVDITALRAAEVERERLLAELQARHRELEARAEEVRALNASLEQRVQARTAELEAIFASIPDALYVADENGILRCNQTALDYFGCRSIEELHQKLPRLAARMRTRYADTGQLIPRAELGLVRALRGERTVLETLTTHPVTHQEQAHRVTAGPIELNGQIVAAVAVAADITERQRAEQALARSARQLEILHDIDRAVLAARSLEDTARDALRRLSAALPCDRAVLSLIDFEARQAQYLVAEGAGPTRFTPGRPQSLDTPPDILAALREGQTWYDPDLAAEMPPVASHVEAVAAGLRAWLAIPLQVEGHVLGALSLTANRPAAFSGEDIDLAQRIADSLAVAVHNARLLDNLRASREQLKRLSHRLVELQERERSYVAKELYDDEGQRLAALLLELVAIGHATPANPALQERISRTKELANRVLADMHSLAVLLRPASLDQLGLVAGLRHYAEQLGKEYNLNIQVEPSRTEQLDLAPDTETMLYRIAQEAVMNAVHHAQARQIGIAAVRHGERVTLLIEDDGQGFDVAQVTRFGGLGILGMRERAEMLGGSLAIESVSGKGTVVYIEVPVHTPPAREEEEPSAVSQAASCATPAAASACN